MDAAAIKDFLDEQEKRVITLERGPHSLVSALQLESFRAQQYLWSAQTAVENALTAAFVTRNLNRVATGKSMAGNMGDSEQDLLRAALVFAGAGLDSALKRLVRDSLGTLAKYDERVQKGLHDYAEAHITSGAVAVDATSLVKILMADAASPRDVLLAAWRDDVTSGSLQSVDKVNEICTVLGVLDPAFRKRIATNKATLLREAFHARNQIVHELDLNDPTQSDSNPGDIVRRRRRRGANKLTEYSTEILSITQIIIDHVGTTLSEHGTK